MKPVATMQAFETSNQSQASANLVQAQVQLQSGNVSALKSINLPTFSGKQREWESYKEQFEALVKNKKTIPPILKFRRLLKCLEGDAFKTIQSIRVVAENFDNAWQSLCDKYHNEPLRFFIQMQTLEELCPANKESADHLS